MDYFLTKKLADCLETAYEIREFLNEGKFQQCHTLIKELIGGIDACLDDSLRTPTPDPSSPVAFSKPNSKEHSPLR